MPRRNLLAFVNRKTIRTQTEKAAVQEKRNTLRRQIEKWHDIQRVYMPGLAALRGHDTDPDARESMNEERPEVTKLWLPSNLPESHRNAACLRGVVLKEKRLRHAQVSDALVELRRSHRVQKRVWDHFKVSVAGTGQRQMTRSRAILHGCTRRIEHTFQRYNAVRASLLKLDPTGTWKETYRELSSKENKGPTRGDDEPGDGDWTPSWIWTVSIDPELAGQRTGENSQEEMNREYNDAMRVEWATIVARADRWEEEYELLLMEMGRTLKFFEWKAGEWDRRADETIDVPNDISRGLIAYAHKQAAVYRYLAQRAISRFKPVLDDLKERPDWLPVTPMAAPPRGLASLSLSDHPEPTNSKAKSKSRSTRFASMVTGQVPDSDNSEGENDDKFDDDDDAGVLPDDGYTSDVLDIDCD